MKKYRYQWRIVLILFAVWGTINLFRMSINFLFSFMAVDFAFNESILSLFTSWISLFWALGVFASGKATDYFKEYKIFIFGMLVLALGAITLKISINQMMVYLALAIIGFGGGIQGPTCIVMLTNYTNPQKLGTYLGLVQSSSGLLGLTFGATAIISAGEVFGWQKVYLILCVYVFVLALIILRKFRPISTDENKVIVSDNTDNNETGTFLESWSYRNIKVISIVSLAIFSWSMLISAYALPFFTENGILNMTKAGTAVGALGIGGFVGTIVITSISDYTGRKSATFGCILASTIAFFFVAFCNISYIPILICMFFVGLSVQGLLALISGVIPSESVPANLINKAASLVPTLAEFIGCVLIPFLCSFLVKAWGSTMLFKLLILWPIVALIACLILKESKKK